MFFLMQKMLECSMRMGKSRRGIVRLLGRLLAVYPVWYAERMERRLMDGSWNPAEKWQKKQRKRKRRGKNRG
ncbi:MAG TPA: hypothetical protein IAA26_09005 [Candidatus Blautia faecipullorum]|nr:hypothetical protein [Candidatus Blautia faecipullorum]